MDSGMRISQTAKGSVAIFTTPEAVMAATIVPNHIVVDDVPQMKLEVLVPGTGKPIRFEMRPADEFVVASIDRNYLYDPSYALELGKWQKAIEFLDERALDAILDEKPLMYVTMEKGWKQHTAKHAIEHYIFKVHESVFETCRAKVSAEPLDKWSADDWSKFKADVRSKLLEPGKKRFNPAVRNDGRLYCALQNYGKAGPKTQRGDTASLLPQATCKKLLPDMTTYQKMSSTELLDETTHGSGDEPFQFRAKLSLSSHHVIPSSVKGAQISHKMHITSVTIRPFSEADEEDEMEFDVTRKSKAAVKAEEVTRKAKAAPEPAVEVKPEVTPEAVEVKPDPEEAPEEEAINPAPPAELAVTETEQVQDHGIETKPKKKDKKSARGVAPESDGEHKKKKTKRSAGSSDDDDA
jgi:hypothetical protein